MKRSPSNQGTLSHVCCNVVRKQPRAPDHSSAVMSPASAAPQHPAPLQEISSHAIYFTSDLFVDPLRKDVTTLLNAFSEGLEVDPPLEDPEALFQELWVQKDWNVIYLKCTSSESRAEFIKTVTRVFIGERISKSNHDNSGLRVS